jgi:hypothetical protein
MNRRAFTKTAIALLAGISTVPAVALNDAIPIEPQTVVIEGHVRLGDHE